MMGRKMKTKGMRNGGKVKTKGMKNGGKVMSKGYRNGGKVGMTLPQLRAAAKQMGMKISKA
mgnify:FL=1